MNLKSYSEAKKAGDKHYMPKKPCIRGHSCKALVSVGCVECNRLRAKCNKWRKFGTDVSLEDMEKAEGHVREMAERNSRSLGISLLSREDARAIGEKVFFDGIPCRIHGHVSCRYVSNKNCLMCEKEYSKTPKRIKYLSEWRKENSEKQSISKKAWLKLNKDRTNATSAKRRFAKLQRDICPDPSLIEFCMLEAYQHCRDMEGRFGGHFEIDHALPLLGECVSGLHVPANLQAMPKGINVSKGNRMIYTEPFEWLADYS